ncbi:hypothetical protein P8452_03424 [Trifolium repens]|nr:hypothetical protein P8452_03423 [Trifolium repens]WJX12978.1 hypothetical protein P8452_03424 [Trifolium repens]
MILSIIHIYHSLLLRRRCWSFSNGEFVKAGIGVMRQQYTGSDWDELKHTRQAIGFLVSIFFATRHLAYIRNVERGNRK